MGIKGVKLLVIDLDNTLCDTFHNLSLEQWKKAIRELEKRGYKKEAAVIKKDFGKTSFVHAIQSLQLPNKERMNAFRSYQSTGVKRLKLFPDAHDILSLDLPKVLVTRGEKDFQDKKIKHLGIKKYFAEVYYVPSFKHKKDAFVQILKKYKLKAREVLVIGDRIEEEIKDAKSMKIPCVLVRRPKWPVREYHHITPDYTVSSLRVVKRLLKK